MQITKEEFKKELEQKLDSQFAVDVEHASLGELYSALSNVLRDGYAPNWRETRIKEAHEGKKQVYYFSIEFLPGTLLRSNLLNLGWMDTVKSALKDLGLNLDDIAAKEPDMALGNGGLGRLAAAFMDSLASTGYVGNGNGIHYKYGLFKQKFVNGYQVELPNDWLQKHNHWEVMRDNKSVLVHFGGQVNLVQKDNWMTPEYNGGYSIKAVPYDIPVVGYHTGIVNTMRLWDAEIPESEEINYPTIDDRRKVEDLTSILYPDDSSYSGRLLRLKQEYFFVSAGLQSILRYYTKDLKQNDMHNLPKYVAVHINDTHPAMAVAELMRLLVDEYHIDWDEAWKITVQVISYTNHTIMAEAMEKWDINMMTQLLPRIMQIITEIDRRYVISLTGKVAESVINDTRIVNNGNVQMAHLAIIGSHSVNGVAPLHTHLLETEVLKEFYELYPERFNNKTNGITLRRWLQIANPKLSKLLDQTVGRDWRTDSAKMLLLQDSYKNAKVLKQINEIKLENKEKLAKFIKKTTGITVDPTAIFDVQIKRLHAYKRQTLKLLHIIKLYHDLKNGIDHPKRVVIFGAKAAPSYTYAKDVIKVINEVANVINNDASIHGKLKVIFLENYDVTLAEKIIPAADISEQISTTTKEASGTSNMKLMANGALTVATMDGANVDIAKAVGQDNIFIFGLNKDQVYDYYNKHDYKPRDMYNSDQVMKETVDALIDGSFSKAANEGRVLYDSFLQENEEFLVLADFESYLQAQKKIEENWHDQRSWTQKALVNIAHSEEFNADNTVARYAKDIWGLKKLN
ncbi:glycogen/starch/alpha-glucan phosphorylase [Lactobacillus kefiranofaciens]|uniref:Alpha-1,4 glucan phosphorylase n=1 Tax=Lactobacillus kefiranofaciens TaxID=267818 RepID=A0AAX3UEP0_9LACO|nr:glycogen/starch/alpha-glucan phosphorylase [Lactobacillus kefiranofaciens]AEG40660.1 Glycogen phosphorylase [Lactobacillus kefiranofaciens subsp. kefiranofaciens]KRM22675.1 glycogen phosphorylase [Lactobacillus kefiranofaciens subsp. kefiranofaciens DSM 5016 = JCM 6985]QFQ68177.1 glycogen/starch/alpha-glucan phosphorylase [Lactobacillus kefiranofaciens subsp. kefiranofaciens]WGO86038.1 glycogen/starch/alpha-glucan phosphorylase [Lactobacillus kefiranofaciens]WQH36644.1 glycogen/starch/alpha